MNSFLTVREVTESDIESIVGYWLQSDKAFLQNMGVDIAKLPARDQLSLILQKQINTPLEQRSSYCIIWQANGMPIGHCNTNPTFYGNEAYMHLHLWNDSVRKKGLGTALVKMTLPHFFDRLKLKRLVSEPYALNVAPNKSLLKVGFELVKEYTTIPGSINFEQPVKRWEMTLEKYQQLKRDSFF
ncbi:MAG: N-acetyltransferase [Sphingobacteriales bacterium]|nr:MAG: N-acetyltransferase [Sphingobacteriales bacterium]